MERTVVLVRLYHHITAVFLKQDIRAVVHANTAQESVRAYFRLIEKVSQHRAGSRLTMRTCHTERFQTICHQPQYLCPLADRITLFAQIGIDSTILWNCRCAHNQCVLRIERNRRVLQKRRIVLIRNGDPFTLQLFRQSRRRTVVTRHRISAMMKITR